MYMILHSESLHSVNLGHFCQLYVRVFQLWLYDMQWCLTGLCLRQVLGSLRESQHEDASSRKESSSWFICSVYQQCITYNCHLTYSLTYSTSPKLPKPENSEHAVKGLIKEKYKEIIFCVLSQLKSFYFTALLPKFVFVLPPHPYQ